MQRNTFGGEKGVEKNENMAKAKEITVKNVENGQEKTRLP